MVLVLLKGGLAHGQGIRPTGILLIQRMVTSPEPSELVEDFWAAAYAAIDA